jgi:hypothetical protein
MWAKRFGVDVQPRAERFFFGCRNVVDNNRKGAAIQPAGSRAGDYGKPSTGASLRLHTNAIHSHAIANPGAFDIAWEKKQL